MKKILITGSTGFVGINLIDYLNNKNFETQSLFREELHNPNQISFANSGAIVHLAGKAHDLKKTSIAEEYYNVNFELTKRIYDSFLKSEAEKFIFISSVKAAADTVEGVLTEEIIPNPQTHYGKSKLMAEQYIQAQELPKGKSYYILRPCMIHGPGNKGNLNLLYQFVKKGIPYPLAAFENRRSYLTVENLCFVIKNLIEKNVPSGIYHIADDDAFSTNETVSILSQSLNKQARLWSISPSLIRFLAKIGDKIKLPINTERLNKLTENYIVGTEKIKKALNADLPISSIDGLKITAASFKSK